MFSKHLGMFVWNVSGRIGGVCLTYLEPPNSLISKNCVVPKFVQNNNHPSLLSTYVGNMVLACTGGTVDFCDTVAK